MLRSRFPTGVLYPSNSSQFSQGAPGVPACPHKGAADAQSRFATELLRVYVSVAPSASTNRAHHVVKCAEEQIRWLGKHRESVSQQLIATPLTEKLQLCRRSKQ